MKVLATNIGSKRIIKYRGKNIETGIYKSHIVEGIYLEQEDVKHDDVVDRRFHGGIDKACYLYSSEAYEYWRPLYPDLVWEYGMFGENLTIVGLNEKALKVGDRYKVGEAIIEISQPRQPCFKLGVRMGTQAILKQFINTTYSGSYVRVIESGLVKKGDELILIREASTSPTILDIFETLYQKEIFTSKINKILNCELVPDSAKEDIKKRL